MIRTDNLSKTFRVHRKQPGLRGSLASLFNRQWINKNALLNINLEISEGEIVGLVGANGAGKTTLVKCLSGIIHPSEGSATVLGHIPWKREDTLRRNIALIMGQKAQLWWDLPAADCFLLLREIYRVPEKKHLENLSELAETLKVTHLLTTQIRRLSLGERMKMELIAALLHEPRVIYLDEPTIGLDFSAQKAIRKFLLEYHSRHKPTILLTSHYMQDILELCKRIIIISEGKIIYDGSLENIINEHSNHKLVRATLSNEQQMSPPAFPQNLGQLVHQSDKEIKLRVKRKNVTLSVQWLLENYRTLDMHVQDEDVAEIVESLTHGKNK